MSKIALIQLARYGDIVSILPYCHFLSKNNEVTIYVHEDFTSILDAVSYVKVRIVKTTHRDVENTEKIAKKEGNDLVICSQVASNPYPKPKATNYQTEQWVRMEALDKLHDLPLVFDKRNLDEEHKLVVKHINLNDPRPLLCYNLISISSPFFKRNEFDKWLIEKFNDRYQIVDLGSIKAKNPAYLLGILDKCDKLITVDTLHLHLSYAVKCPTIALVQENVYKQSESRSHWLDKLTYSEALTPKGKERLWQHLVNH